MLFGAHCNLADEFRGSGVTLVSQIIKFIPLQSCSLTESCVATCLSFSADLFGNDFNVCICFNRLIILKVSKHVDLFNNCFNKPGTYIFKYKHRHSMEITL